MNKFVSLIIITFLLYSCGDSSNKSTCPLGQPVPIFSSELSKVSSHDFKSNGQKGNETIIFTDGSQLEVLQDGCEKITQEFRFQLKEFDPKWNTEDWFEAAIAKVNFLSTISKKHQDLQLWASAISQQKAQWKLSGEMVLGPGFNAKVDRILGGEQALLIVQFYQS